MSSLLIFLKKYKVPTFLLALASILFFFFISTEKEPRTQTFSQSQSMNDQLVTTSQKKEKSKKTQKREPSQSTEVNKEDLKEFSYQDEVQRVRALTKKLPQSESQLIALITKEDYFKAHAQEIKPHSFDEITQNQMGAIKVLALKALMSQAYSSGNIQKNLTTVIQTAQDPTIVNIAKAALDSTKKGRPFFKDFTEGLDGMPL